MMSELRETLNEGKIIHYQRLSKLSGSGFQWRRDYNPGGRLFTHGEDGPGASCLQKRPAPTRL